MVTNTRTGSRSLKAMGAAAMKDHELREAIREKNRAWAELAAANRRCMAYQRTRANGGGYPDLPEGWAERRDELRAAYEDVRGRYLRMMLGRAQVRV
jgi:hypothetical protein